MNKLDSLIEMCTISKYLIITYEIDLNFITLKKTVYFIKKDRIVNKSASFNKLPNLNTLINLLSEQINLICNI